MERGWRLTGKSEMALFQNMHMHSNVDSQNTDPAMDKLTFALVFWSWM